MSITTKTALPVILVALLLSLSAYLIQKNVVFPAFSKIEQNYARDNIDRVVRRLQGELETVDFTVYDWSSWNDTYQYMDDMNEDFVESNLGADTFLNYGIEMALFLNESGEAVWAGYFDFDGEEYDSNLMAPHLSRIVATARKFSQQIDPDTPIDHRKVSGVIQMEGAPLLFSMRPIHKSDGTGEPRGYVMFGELLDESRVTTLSEQIVLDFSVKSIDPDTGEKHSDNYTIQALNRDQLRASRTVTLSGQPALTASVILPRDITILGSEITLYGISLFVLLSLILSASLLVLFRVLVIKPILELKDDISRIADGMDYSLRTHIRNEDEIGSLSREFNTMLGVIESNNEELKRLTETDPLTGLYNRLALDKKFEQAWDILNRTGDPLAIMLIDIDHFKEYNDHYGHPAGDDCLKKIAQILRDSAKRDADMVARYGGEEFLIVLPGTSMEAGMTIARELLQAVADKQIPHELSQTSEFVTISIGLSAAVPSVDYKISELIDAADQAMYRIKNSGRNGVESQPLDTQRP